MMVHPAEGPSLGVAPWSTKERSLSLDNKHYLVENKIQTFSTNLFLTPRHATSHHYNKQTKPSQCNENIYKLHYLWYMKMDGRLLKELVLRIRFCHEALKKK